MGDVYFKQERERERCKEKFLYIICNLRKKNVIGIFELILNKNEC